MPTRKVEILDLHNAVSAVAPIDGVARLKDDAIRIDFKPEATAKQRRDADAVAAAWNWNIEVEREATVEERLSAAETKLAALSPGNRTGPSP